MRDTRADVIWRHLTFALNNAKLDRENYADDVARLYQERTAPGARSIEFHAHKRGNDPYKVRVANKQLVFRMLDPDGPVRMPVEIEEAAVLALPDPFRDRCQSELAQRLGLMAAPIPPATGEDAIATCGELTESFGDCLKALAATLGDGHLDPSDAAKAPAAITEIDRLITLAMSVRAGHVAILEGRKPPKGATVHAFPSRDGANS